MKYLGLVGERLSHSFSPRYFENKFLRLQIDCKYKLFELENISEVTKLLTNFQNLVGFNVTLPYKRQIIPFLNALDAAAFDIQAVNTALKHPDPSLGWIGYNTDWYGFEMALLELLKNRTIPPAIILGAGGAAQAVVYALLQYLPASSVVICSRNPPLPSIKIFQNLPYVTFTNLSPNFIKHFPLIINTTPLGMHPAVNKYPPIPIDALSTEHYVIDLIYNPEETLLLRLAKERGAQTQNGLPMLQYQAEKAWEIWSSHWTF